MSETVTIRCGEKTAPRDQEEVLARVWSDSWQREMPVTLITFPSGQRNVHCQTGDHHYRALDVAREMLW